MEGKKGFSLSNAATAKRGGEQQPASRKIPKVGETADRRGSIIQPRTGGGGGCALAATRMKLEPPRQNNPRPQTNAPVNICVYKVTDASGDVWPQFPDTKLWQIQALQKNHSGAHVGDMFFLGDGGETRVEVEHDARPSVSVNIVASMNEYLKAAKGLPESVQKLQSDAGIKLVIANLDVRNMKIRGFLTFFETAHLLHEFFGSFHAVFLKLLCTTCFVALKPQNPH